MLTGAGVAFEAVSPGVDETSIKDSLLAEGVSPRDIADALAEAKALKVSLKRPGLVIGADQTLDLEGRLFDKADGVEEARARLKELRGKTHRLHCGMVVAKDGAPIWREVVTSDPARAALLRRLARRLSGGTPPARPCPRSAATTWKARARSCSTASRATISPSSACR